MKHGLNVICLMLMCSLTCRAATIRVPTDQPTIQAGIDFAIDGDTILVADGTYSGDGNRDISFNGKAITVRSENGPGFCIIDCDGIGRGRGFVFTHDEGPGSRLSGFTITNGYEDGGGGISCSHASPTIDHCIITGNATGWRGGGIGLYSSNAMISDCIISNNHALCNEEPAAEDVWGGGVYTLGGSPVFTNCHIIDNTAEQWLYQSHDAWGIAGGIYAAPATLINCVISGNTANKAVGGGYFDSASSLINCTITGNTGLESDGGIRCETSVFLMRCIAWNNTPDSLTGNPSVTYSDVQGGHVGEGNINSDPLFVTGASGAYYLSHSNAGQTLTSPCVNAGDVPASDVCFETALGTRCLTALSTRTDLVYDFSRADLGFHYPGPECDDLGISLVIASIHIEPLERLILALDTCNPSQDIIPARIYMAIEAAGYFFFRPTWTQSIDYETRSISPGMTTTMIFDFPWPETGSAGHATFIALMTNKDGTDALGTWGLTGFDWE